MLFNEVLWDHELIAKYDKPAPRYTSYPTALEFDQQLSEQDLLQAFQKYTDKNLSVYVHIPFCHKLCYFCGCNKVVTTHQEKADIYLDFLEREIKARAPLFKNRTVTQLHWGGGTPTYLTCAQASRLMDLLKNYFHVHTEAEISLEMDPRKIDNTYLYYLKTLGFNRISIGIQDFNIEVQRLINREQDEGQIFGLVQYAKELGFKSISVDLIYGLPKQTLDSFHHTLEKVKELDPDRISVFNFAYLPNLIKAHKMINAEDIPDAELKLEMFQDTIQFFQNSDYQFIGMDHFAKKTDELAILQNERRLHRNFQGYTTQGESDLLGLGVSAISMIGDVYAQNEKILSQYYEAVKQKETALLRGFKLSEEDCMRRDIIKQIVCDFQLQFADYEKKYHINFKDKFYEELEELRTFSEDGLLELNEQGFTVMPVGRLLIRHIAMAFDVYSKAKQQIFSKAI
ncbi:MAG: oxygen-independent coproporphyrinogen III oxidase [Neisseriaceae bacterium]|nr:MAG: oxygen-independent coproporphyrinogen III oxidase [Neisseriaceae bacterium]